MTALPSPSTEAVIWAILERADRVARGVDDQTATVACLKRFEQLQDLLVRLLRALLTWEAEEARAMTMRDLGDQLEKLRLIDAAPAWMDAARLLETLRQMPFLRGLVTGVRQHLVREGFFDD